MEYETQPLTDNLPIASEKTAGTLFASSAAVLSAACWGLATVMSKGTLDHLPPFTLLTLQLTASVIFLWLLVLWQKPPMRLGWKAVKPALTGLLEPGLAATLGTLGLALTTASSTTLIITSEPLVTLALAWFLLREHLSFRVVVLALVALAGVFVITLPEATPTEQASWLGNLLVFLGVVCASLYVVATRRAVVSLDPLPLCALQQSIALIWSLLVLAVIFSTQAGEIGLSALRSDVLMLAVVSGVIGYGLTFWLFLLALRSLPASVASLFLMLIPVFGITGAYAFLGEQLTVTQLAGGGLILGALAWISRLHQRAD